MFTSKKNTESNLKNKSRQSDIEKQLINIMRDMLSELSDLKKIDSKSEIIFAEETRQKIESPQMDLKPLYDLYVNYKVAGFSTNEALKLITLIAILRDSK